MTNKPFFPFVAEAVCEPLVFRQELVWLPMRFA